MYILYLGIPISGEVPVKSTEEIE